MIFTLPIVTMVLAAPSPGAIAACSITGLNQGAWLNINGLVILFALILGAGVYAIATMLPASTRERLRGSVKTEMFQAVLSVFIIIGVLALAYTSCEAGQMLTQELTAGLYQNPMQFAQFYLSNLLFQRSGQIFGQIYSESAIFLAAAHVLEMIVESSGVTLAGGYAQVQLDNNITGVYYGYTGVITGTYTAMIVASYAVLFIFYLILPLTQALALTVLLPLTIVIRSWPFAGPRLRESANSFLALAIALYFILPLAITLNNYVINWVYCGNYVGTGTPLHAISQNCNPYVSYVGFTQFPSLPINSLFAANSVANIIGPGGGTFQVPIAYFGGVFSGQGGIGSIITGSLKVLFDVPGIISEFGYEIAEYMFECIVLIALDIAITIGFAQGLTKALNAAPNILGAGPFWGNV